MTDEDGHDVFGGDFGFDSDAEKEKEEEREKRTVQTEEDYQRQKREWTPKVETREELLKAVSALSPPKTKFDVLTLKSAAELLYYERDYAAAKDVGEQVLKVALNEETYLGQSERNEVEVLVERCRHKIPSTERLT